MTKGKRNDHLATTIDTEKGKELNYKRKQAK